MPKASDLKRGNVVDIDGVLLVVKNVESRSPSSRGAATLYKVRLADVRSGQKRDLSLKGEEFLKEGEYNRRAVQYSYRDGDMLTFMDSEDYSQYLIAADDLEDQLTYINESLEGMTALIVDGRVLSIELPQTVVLEIVDTAPGIKGASASARTKPATLSTGLEIQVPEYLEPGEQVKVNTGNGKFVSRA